MYHYGVDNNCVTTTVRFAKIILQCGGMVVGWFHKFAKTFEFSVKYKTQLIFAVIFSIMLDSMMCNKLKNIIFSLHAKNFLNVQFMHISFANNTKYSYLWPSFTHSNSIREFGLGSNENFKKILKMNNNERSRNKEKKTIETRKTNKIGKWKRDQNV